MELWKDEDTVIFYCYGNSRCRYSFGFDVRQKKVTMVDGFCPEEICKAYAEKATVIEIDPKNVETRFDLWRLWEKKTEQQVKRVWMEDEMLKFLGLDTSYLKGEI